MFHGDLLGERARLTPDREALVEIREEEEPLRFTWAELDARAARAARLLTDVLGLRRGDRVGLLSHNCTEFLDVFFGAGKCGVIVVPLTTRGTAPEIQRIADDSGLEVVIHGAEFADIVRRLRGLRRTLEIDRHGESEWMRLHAGLSNAPVHYRGEGEDIYCLLYTSGTTGKPKGVMIPARMLVWNAYNTAICWDLRQDDRTPVFTPLYHAGGLAAFMLPTVAIGGTIVLHRRFDVAEVWRTIETEKCTVVLGVPTIWKMLMESAAFPATDLSSIRWLISGGAPLPAYIIETYQRRGVVFKQGYGMTEVGVNCFSMTAEESVRKAGSIGRPMMFTEARLVVDEERDAADGEVGELWLRGPHVSSGYWKNESATRETYLESGWLRTGDYARRDEDGFFYMAGRKKEMFISGGVNVYPAEIEGELLTHPMVADAAVIGVSDEQWGEVGVAFVVFTEGGVATDDELASHLAERLGRYKIPRRWIRIDAMPRTPYGKVVKDDLRRLLDGK